MKLVLQILSLVSTLIPLVDRIIQIVQQAFGPGTGPIKKELVQGVVMDALAADPQATDGIPPAVLEAIVSSAIDRQVKAQKTAAPAQ